MCNSSWIWDTPSRENMANQKATTTGIYDSFKTLVYLPPLVPGFKFTLAVRCCSTHVHKGALIQVVRAMQSLIMLNSTLL